MAPASPRFWAQPHRQASGPRWKLQCVACQARASPSAREALQEPPAKPADDLGLPAGSSTAGAVSLGHRLRSALVPALCSCALALLAVTAAPPAVAGPSDVDPYAPQPQRTRIRFRASTDPELRQAQEVLVQAWGYVREYFYDPTFNRQDWDQRLQSSLDATFAAPSPEAALREAETMLASLGDPFTRLLLPGGGSEAFEAQTQAQIISNGLVVGRDAGPERLLRVAFVVPQSPAARAGVAEGDLVVAVNGRAVQPQGDKRDLLAMLGQDREVDLKLKRREAADNAGAARTSSTLPRRVAPGAGDGQSARPSSSGGAGAVESGTELLAASSSMPQAPPLGGFAEPPSDTAAVGPDGPAYAPAPSTSYALPSRFFDVHLAPEPVDYVPVQFAVLSAPTPSVASSFSSLPSSSPSTSSAGASSQASLGVSRGGGSGGLRAPAEAGLAARSGAAGNDADALPTPDPTRVGYVRIVAFTDHVAAQARGCGAWVLDVRDNPGGIVGEGFAVGELLLRPGDVFAVLRDRSGEELSELVSDGAQAMVEGQPLAVLVDRWSASASELLAGALHDNARALLVGEPTFGKGRTQRVVQLKGRATLLVSTGSYLTPRGAVVDGVGLTPDVACRPRPPPAPMPRPARLEGVEGEAAGEAVEGMELARSQVRALGLDPCVKAAVGKLARGVVPVRPA
ncbi:hypothetical protein HYH03_004163 [Edaphochlamys debaryana]|uniref:PDZ domain-containing protein n=1 Tax=Edaphochlamys debaryana TaxID=47281 RepID=A0A835Y7W1_9CHLO|nr:hypothetical protein HYH03_004163 [Edaphochlamys debaryana]|eukprot:KAG2497897.1 hypothetical protein HYH03_004163 [Edaphochlamys debaryana]